MDKGFHNLTRIMATVSLVSDTVNREEEDDLIEQLVDAADAKFLSEADMRRLNRISIATMTGKLTITERDGFLQWVDEKTHYLRRMLNNMYREMANSSYEAPDLRTMLYKMEDFIESTKDNKDFDNFNARLDIALAKTLMNDYQLIYDIRETAIGQYCG